MKIFLSHDVSIESYRSLVPANIEIADIAHNLSMQCRFNGATAMFYSVAEHSVILMEMLSDLAEDAQRIAILHDAHEAYIGDIVRPVRQFMGSVQIDQLCKELDQHIYTKFGVSRQANTYIDVVKEMDTLLLHIEIHYFFKSYNISNIPMYPILKEQITKYTKRMQCLEHREAEMEYLTAFKRLFPNAR